MKNDGGHTKSDIRFSQGKKKKIPLKPNKYFSFLEIQITIFLNKAGAITEGTFRSTINPRFMIVRTIRLKFVNLEIKV